MRVGIAILPQKRWHEEARQWRLAEEFGFDHAWTIDHLAWRALADEPWFATVPTLTAAATVTSSIRLGTWVANPNFRHPVPFAKELMTLDDMSEGRMILGLGSGGTGFDAEVLGIPPMSGAERHRRFVEFVELLDRLLTNSHTTWTGDYFSAVNARMIPGSTQDPRMPFVVAANGPKGMAFAIARGQGWATTGPQGTETKEEWWHGVARLSRRFAEIEAEHGGADMPRYLELDTGGYSLSSSDYAVDCVGRARELGFTDVVMQWPRERGVFAGSEAVLEEFAARLPDLR